MAEEIERCANTGFGVEFLEHLHRYRLARTYCSGKVVLDAACGTGYGSAILAETAAAVHGIDIADEAVALCRKTFHRENLSFQTASVESLPFPDRFFDVIVSFETIEHVPEEVQKKFLAEIRRLLKPDGVLVISSPDRQYYTVERNKVNPYHVAEFFRRDFFALLEGSFRYCRKADQKIYLCSLVKSERPEAELAVFSSFQSESGQPVITERPPHDFWYNIAVASNVPVAPLPDSVNLDVYGRIFSPDGKTEQEAYIEKLGAHIRELDAERDALVRERGEHLEAIAEYQKHIEELDSEHDSLIAERGEHLAAIQKYQDHVRALDGDKAVLEAERREHIAYIDKCHAHIAALDAAEAALKEQIAVLQEKQAGLERTLRRNHDALAQTGAELAKKSDEAAALQTELDRIRNLPLYRFLAKIHLLS